METNNTKPMDKTVLGILSTLLKSGITPFEGSDKYYEDADKALQERIYQEFGISVLDFKIRKITTKPDEDFILLSINGGFSLFVNTTTGIQSAGYINYYSDGECDLHIAPTVSTGNRIEFMATAAHELSHTVHHCMIQNHGELFTERVAYEQSYGIYMQAGMIDKAEEVKNVAMTHFFNGQPYWGDYEPEYDLNWNIFKHKILCQKLNREILTIKGFYQLTNFIN